MDPEGYLPVTLVASFNRVRSLTNDVTFIVDSVQDSTVVEVKDGKFRPIDDPDSWPIAADQPDPVLSPKPEVQLDPTPDPPPPTSTTNTTTSVAPAVVVASSHDLESAKTTLNPNVPEFVPSFASAQGWSHSFFKEFQQKQSTHILLKNYIYSLLMFQVWIQFETMTKLEQMVMMRLKFLMVNQDPTGMIDVFVFQYYLFIF